MMLNHKIIKRIWQAKQGNKTTHAMSHSEINLINFYLEA